jgi:hypothetical protein
MLCYAYIAEGWELIPEFAVDGQIFAFRREVSI